MTTTKGAGQSWKPNQHLSLTLGSEQGSVLFSSWTLYLTHTWAEKVLTGFISEQTHHFKVQNQATLNTQVLINQTFAFQQVPHLEAPMCYLILGQDKPQLLSVSTSLLQCPTHLNFKLLKAQADH